MSVNQGSTDSIPEEFETYEQVSAFWDAHDTTDYPEAFKPVEFEEIDIKSRRFEVSVEQDLMQILSDRAKAQGIAVNQLLDILLREKLSEAL